ncbi:MAG: hypothetical protein GX780_05795, partial [Campylobacteraceae bacterium]|nr:hypothetical protein [Campylobacteraceae bacterium]
MIIVENRVIFTGAKFNIQMAEDIDLNPPLNASSSTTKICKYWFDRFDGDAGYLKVTMAREDIKKNFGLDYYNGAKINDFIIKVHSNGITST